MRTGDKDDSRSGADTSSTAEARAGTKKQLVQELVLELALALQLDLPLSKS